MKSIIVLANQSTDAETAKSLTILSNQTDTELLVVSVTRPATLPPDGKFVQANPQSMATATKQAIGLASGETILLLDARCSWSGSSAQELLSQCAEDNSLTVFPVNNGFESISLWANSLHGFLNTITTGANMPVACLASKKSLLENIELQECENSAEVMSHLLAGSLAQDNQAVSASLTISAPQDSCSLSDSARARVLKALINTANVEELYPAHDWTNHSSESAAAAYHILAALFIRLGDKESAEECLRLSDQLEDSPRSLALKGIIARDRGEILGAVANMVSSLQQYELRKRDNSGHYSQFQPNSLEVINEKLNAGLQALNKRDNEKALNLFTEAVFSFDPFYGQLGVNRSR